MQELEKILEEIEQKIEKAEKIIVKPAHDKLDEVANDTAEAFIEAYKECQDIIRKYMENDGWISVDRELPPNANHKGALCPRYQVMTKYGVTEGWYNPDYESWFCLLWFMNKKFTKGYIDFERGDVPKVVQIEKGIDIVLAWRPLPEPYKPERRVEK